MHATYAEARRNKKYNKWTSACAVGERPYPNKRSLSIMVEIPEAELCWIG